MTKSNSLPEANPREWAANQPQVAWTLGFELAIEQVTAIIDKKIQELG